MLGKTLSLNEALSRCFISLIIFQCVLDERKTISSIQPKPSSPLEAAASPATPLKAASNTTSLEASVPPEDLSVFVEMELKQEVIYKGKPHLLTGITDYTLGYSNVHTMSGNLVIVEAKRTDHMPAAYGQLLAYMGKHHFFESLLFRF